MQRMISVVSPLVVVFSSRYILFSGYGEWWEWPPPRRAQWSPVGLVSRRATVVLGGAKGRQIDYRRGTPLHSSVFALVRNITVQLSCDATE